MLFCQGNVGEFLIDSNVATLFQYSSRPLCLGVDQYEITINSEGSIIRSLRDHVYCYHVVIISLLCFVGNKNGKRI